MKFWKVFFLPGFVFASVSEPLHVELFSGYRNDRQHWHLQAMEGGALVYSELSRGIQFWENGLDIGGIGRDLVVNARGSCSAFGRGPVYQRYANTGFTSEEPNFQFSSHGFAADVSGYLGYCVDLTPDRFYQVLLVPILGGSGHFERLSRCQKSPSIFVGATGSGTFQMSSSLPEKLRQTWYGFFLGGGIRAKTGGRLVLEAFYSYHWLHCNFKSGYDSNVVLFDNTGAFVMNTSTDTKVKVSDGGNMGHTGWAKIDLIVTKLWKIGFGAQIHYFSSRVVDATINQMDSSFLEKFKLRWTSIAGYVQTSRDF